MANQLENQIILFSVDTSAFYTDAEDALFKRLLRVEQLKSEITKLTSPINKFRLKLNKFIKVDAGSNNYEMLLNEVKQSFEKVTKIIDGNEEKMNLSNEYIIFDKKSKTFKTNKQSKLYKHEYLLNRLIIWMKNSLDVKARKHKGIRSLRIDALKGSNKITQFESSLTRALGIDKDETTTDIFVIRAFRYIIFEQLMVNGFKYLDEEYHYFTSSAGNIRNKKSIWIKKKAHEEVQNKLMCGLTVEQINEKGGMNLNKFNAYTALCNTASTPWDDFDITKAIVVPDFTTSIHAEVDYIDSKTYDIIPKYMDVEINHMDGAGVYLASTDKVNNKSFQFRMPFFKGLMIPFRYDKFIEQFGASGIVKDIYGKEHDVLNDGIKYIFTASQFKMWKMFKKNDSDKNAWKRYQRAFKKYECEAAKCKEDADEFNDKPISYQVLQTLNTMTKDELKEISKYTVEMIEKVGTDSETMMKILGADDSNENKRGFEKALEIYPNLLNDDYSKEVIKEKKRSLVNSAKAGKLIIPGTKRTYIAPDLFAFAEWLFLGIENPKGLLKDGEVSCSLYEDGQRLDVLRSPHLFREHCVRTNVVNEETNKWFITKNIYTSVHDLISKQLMFDVDGDDSLIVSDPLFVSIAERHMQGIKPLQYELGVATQEKITNENIFKGLKSAYSKSSMIGEISNDISKLWATNEPDLDTIRRLVFETNACIDYAKTLWYPTRPDTINTKIKEFTSEKLPHFFRFAKGKEKNQVQGLGNGMVDMLNKIIPDRRIHFTKVQDDFDYKQLMKNPNTEVDNEVIEVFERINKSKHWELKKQLKEKGDSRKQCELAVYKEFRDELLKLGNRQFVVDVLIKYLYDIKKTENKQSLWFMFGNDIVRNLQFNIQGIVECNDCKCTIDQPKQRQIRCDSCQSKRNKENNRKRQQKFKSKITLSYITNQYVNVEVVDTVGLK